MIKEYYSFKYIVPQKFVRTVSESLDHHIFLGDVSISIPYDGSMIVCVNSDCIEKLDYLLEEWEENKVTI